MMKFLCYSLVIYINGQKVVTDIKVNDGHWHFVCITWESENGGWNIYIDGLLRDSGSRLAKKTFIQGNRRSLRCGS